VVQFEKKNRRDDVHKGNYTKIDNYKLYQSRSEPNFDYVESISFIYSIGDEDEGIVDEGEK
jgi:hypothetical protein